MKWPDLRANTPDISTPPVDFAQDDIAALAFKMEAHGDLNAADNLPRIQQLTGLCLSNHIVPVPQLRNVLHVGPHPRLVGVVLAAGVAG